MNKKMGKKKNFRKENWEKKIEKTKTKKREDEGEKLKKKMKERKVGSKNLSDVHELELWQW